MLPLLLHHLARHSDQPRQAATTPAGFTARAVLAHHARLAPHTPRRTPR